MEKLVDYAKSVLKKFSSKPVENMELKNQLKALPDEELREMHEGYPSNLHIKGEMDRRGILKEKKR